ncbi:hypothetical protein EDC96DRAFT_215627 [Choanephora cucurbitarum]|nr:hypothetical protein EDC96DRAFT_215627 [Choanephora cucurbitarum]
MKTRQRKQRGVLNIAELPPQHIQRSKPLRRAEILRAHLKLKQLIDQEEFGDARLLFTELIRTSRYNLHNFWKIGIQIIGRTSPNQLTDYLRAVYINAPPYLSLVTFSAYIDQLMIDKKWSKAIEEIDLLFARPQYHHPILLRKKAVCSYENWVQAKRSLPDEDEIQDEYDPAVIRYERCLKIAAKNLEEAYKFYDFDVELVSFMYNFLKATEEEKAKDVVLRSLNTFENRPDFYLLK